MNASTKMLKRKYFRNYILCGEKSCYCLLCKLELRTREIDTHISCSSHQKKKQNDYRVPEFIQDCIFKVHSYFYCSICNITLRDIPEIKEHIVSNTHKEYKINPMAALTRVEVRFDPEVITFYIGSKESRTGINHLQWNGIIDKICVICNRDIVSVGDHLHKSVEHSIKLIQARVYSISDHYYRKIEDCTFHCFTCKLQYPMSSLDDHFMNHSDNNSAVQLNNNFPIKTGPYGKLVLQCCNADVDDQILPKHLCGKDMDIVTNTEWDIELFSGIRDDYLEVDENAKALICKECKMSVKTSLHGILDHLISHYSYKTKLYSYFMLAVNKYIDKYYIRKYDHGGARSKAAQFAYKNYIKMNAGGSLGYCTMCDKLLSAHFDVFKSHAEGVIHSGHLELKKILKPTKQHVRENYKHVPMYDLINTLSYSAEKKSFLVNRMLIIAEDSFFLMKRIVFGKHYKKTKCFACDESILPEDEKEHCISWKHKSNLLEAQSIFDDKLFIREIKPRLYHCSLCNATLPFWENLVHHCQHLNHRMKIIESVPDLIMEFEFPKQITLNTNKDNIYMQLLNAVFNTKYVIKLH